MAVVLSTVVTEVRDGTTKELNWTAKALPAIVKEVKLSGLNILVLNGKNVDVP